MKITEKVSFNIASEASYVYILSGQKLIKNAKIGQFLRVFEDLKLAVKQCYQKRSVLIGQKLVENAKIQMRYFGWFSNTVLIINFLSAFSHSSINYICCLLKALEIRYISPIQYVTRIYRINVFFFLFQWKFKNEVRFLALSWSCSESLSSFYWRLGVKFPMAITFQEAKGSRWLSLTNTDSPPLASSFWVLLG